MNTKYIFLDIDGTLFDHNNPDVPESAKLAISLAKANKHKVFISSGGSYRDIPDKIKDLKPDGYVLGIGSHIICDNRTIAKVSLPLDLALNSLQYLLDNNLGFKIDCIDSIRAYLKEGQRFVYNTVKEDLDQLNQAEIQTYLNDHHLYFDDSIIDIVRAKDYEILKITTFDKDPVKTEKIIKNLSKDLTYYIARLGDSDIYFSEIKHKDVHKAKGIQTVLDYYGANREDTIAIGDSINDLEMIEYSNIGIAMGNGCKELKEKADYITTSVAEDGIYNAFKHFELI